MLNLAMLFPQAMVYTLAYENIRLLSERFQSRLEGDAVSPALIALGLASLVNHPFETLRRRVMMAAYGLTSMNLKVKPSTFAMNLYKQDKLKFLFFGWNVAAVRAVVMMGLGWVKADRSWLNEQLYGNSRTLK